MIRVDADQRRAFMARRHHLDATARAASPTEVARSLVALHSTDPASVYLSCMARTTGRDAASVTRALYDDRSLVRMLGMRRTVFVVAADVAPVVQAGCTAAIAVTERRKLVQLLEKAGIATDGASWLKQVEDETMAALQERGQALGQELSAVVPGLREHIAFGDETKKWAGVVSLTTRVLFLLAADGRIVRGRPRGTWTSSQYRWALWADWLPDGDEAPSPESARVELARRWLAAYGPAPVADLRWWTGWTASQSKRALGALEPVDVDLDGTHAIVLPDDVAAATGAVPSEPWAALLPALDPTIMGWADRRWFLDDDLRPSLFDRSGNVGPTAWWDGHVVGGWAQRADGDIAVRLLRDVGAEAADALARAGEVLRQAIGEVRIISRFRTPLEKELRA